MGEDQAMGLKVCKFGGTSLADASQFRKVQAIILADPQRRYVVPSAPGKRTSDDPKVTDLLYLCQAHVSQKVPFEDVFNLLSRRFLQIEADLGLSIGMDKHLEQVRKAIAGGASADYTASRGEYLNGLILAALLKYEFVDAAEMVFFNSEGSLDRDRTDQAVARRLRGVERAVVPGFYGTGADGQVKTFSRGGSDISGAVVAAGVKAEVYENWTDVNGLLMADPRVVKNPHTIDVVTYRELRELAYMGANVLHDEAIFPVRRAGIPVNVRNTNDPSAAGTMIVPEEELRGRTMGAITGIAGRRDFTVIALEKSLMNSEIGFGRKLLTVLENHGVSFEHCPSGIDTMSVVVADASVKNKMDKVLEDIRAACQPDAMETYPNMALIATVGRGMAHTPGMAARVFTALAGAAVNIRMIDQGSSEINIIVGVETADFEKAVRAIYEAFVK
ncbi:MAG: aspartate kinase [Phycisphaeraceae bacterium]|nr:aspartate kinase [Phycisphaeraceae bacterium]